MLGKNTADQKSHNFYPVTCTSLLSNYSYLKIFHHPLPHQKKHIHIETPFNEQRSTHAAKFEHNAHEENPPHLEHLDHNPVTFTFRLLRFALIIQKSTKLNKLNIIKVAKARSASSDTQLGCYFGIRRYILLLVYVEIHSYMLHAVSSFTSG